MKSETNLLMYFQVFWDVILCWLTSHKTRIYHNSTVSISNLAKPFMAFYLFVVYIITLCITQAVEGSNHNLI